MVEIATHRCFIQPVVEEEEPEDEDEDEDSSESKAPLDPLFVYADIEAMQMPDRTFQVNLLCYRHHEEETIHTLCGSQCVKQFLECLDDLTEVPEDERERPIIIIFHNLKGFDGMFLIEELYNQQRCVEKQLTVGAKVLSFKSGPLTFKDSLCFLPMPLSAFTATFNLQELKKGYFPHEFNTPDHQTYVGPIPDLKYYDPDGLDSKKRKALETWHAEQVRRNVNFDFAKELQEYCQSDVALLQGGCEAFCKEFETHAEFNPFAKCVTIASACNLYWRKFHLPVDTIAVRPLQGWRGAQVTQSLKALQWLYYCESQLPKEGACADVIKHVRNGREQTVVTDTDSYFVDGYDPITRTVYEFHGCFWHGCDRCYPRHRYVKQRTHANRTMEDVFRATQIKIQTLRRAGYTVLEMWECDWDKLVESDVTVQAFVTDHTLVAPLEPRDAFFGGRTGAVTLHATTNTPEEEISYVDVTSLYPWVNKTQVYPVGHPHIITQPADQTLASYFGLALVDILPPSELFHPVLPVRSGGKLTFPLCAACVREEQSRPMLERTHVCHHSDQERFLRGTWCTPEIMKAVEVGYRLLKVHEVWHFPQDQRKSGLFKDYVNTWLKIKQESAGWPRWCVTEEDKQRYLCQYLEHEGIQLERAKIKKNPGRKATAKLMLNSFWGKFGERANKPCTVAIDNPSNLYNYLFDPLFNVSTLRLCTDDILELVYTHHQDNIEPSCKTNIFVAAFTTCWARLKLYESLHLLQQQVLYYDTDSVIYKWSPGLPRVPIGDYLGDMTDELEGDVIEEFVSGGAKNYSYRTRSEKIECKVRGFALNVRGAAVLNFHSMKVNILNELDQPRPQRRTLNIVNPNHFERNTTTKSIRLVERIKQYGLVFDKRVIDVCSRVSFPYGFLWLDEEQREDLDMLLEL